MRNLKHCVWLLLAAALFSAPLRSAAQVAAPSPYTCPCTDYRFAPKTEKAKAVAAFWQARRKYQVSGSVGAMAMIFTEIVGRPTNEFNDARAASLGGLTVRGRDEEAPVVVTLKEGVDYELKGPR